MNNKFNFCDFVDNVICDMFCNNLILCFVFMGYVYFKIGL